MTIPEQQFWSKIVHSFREFSRKAGNHFDWTFVQLMVRDPLVERSALGLLALITALLLFKARVVATDPDLVQFVDGRYLAHSAGTYGIFFGMWFTALLSNSIFCPRMIRESGGRYRALESYNKATGEKPSDPGFKLYEGFFDRDNRKMPTIRAIIVIFASISFLFFFASLYWLTRAVAPFLG